MIASRYLSCGALLLLACGGPAASSNPSTGNETSDSASQSADSDGKGTEGSSSDEFKTKHSTTAGSAHGVSPSKIKATNTHAAMKFFVVDKSKDAPVEGIVIAMQGPDGKKHYTGETDALGYGEVLVPVGQDYEIVYLSLGEKDINAKVTVSGDPRQNIKLTLRFKRWVDTRVAAVPPTPDAEPSAEPAEKPKPVFRLEGVTFASSSSELLPESFERLDTVVEYLTYKKSARIEVSGHTDNTGNKRKNKALSEKRAQACRDYFISKGIDGDRIEAIGYGDEQPVASNDTKEGQQTNRRIEAKEL